MITLLALALLQAGGTFTAHTYASDAGSRQYWLYVPSSYDGTKPMPLVVMLHGCTQDANDSARGTRLNERAETDGFMVVYPEQPAAANPLKCWNWFDAQHQGRDTGEPAIIAGMVREVSSSHRVDEKRVFLGGISAGAAMANIVAINHPELFAALALHSGIQFKAATSVLEARKAMNEGGPDPVAQGKAAHAAMGERARVIPVLIMQGAQDKSVPPLHTDQLARQWLTIDEALGAGATDPETTRAESDSGYHFAREVFSDAQKRVLVETIVVDELAHAWSGGSAAGTFTDPKGPDATAEMLRFFFASVK
jgi:poly(hydroxyalkanoate) depolymerase family esterase